MCKNIVPLANLINIVTTAAPSQINEQPIGFDETLSGAQDHLQAVKSAVEGLVLNGIATIGGDGRKVVVVVVQWWPCVRLHAHAWVRLVGTAPPLRTT